jgi:hypothetical protein
MLVADDDESVRKWILDDEFGEFPMLNPFGASCSTEDISVGAFDGECSRLSIGAKSLKWSSSHEKLWSIGC